MLPVLVASLNLDKLADLFQSYTETINTLWALYATVALAALGFLYKDGQPQGKLSVKITLSIAFALFAGGNCTALHRHQTILHELSNALRREGGGCDPLLNSFIAVPPSMMVLVHVGFTLAVLALIWVPGLMGRAD